MNNSQEINCPQCGHAFKPIDTAWRVCNDCLQIIPPGEANDHKPDNCIKKLGSYTLRYEEEKVKELQQRKIDERRGQKMTVGEAKSIIAHVYTAGSVEESNYTEERYENAKEVIENR